MQLSRGKKVNKSPSKKFNTNFIKIISSHLMIIQNKDTDLIKLLYIF